MSSIKNKIILAFGVVFASFFSHFFAGFFSDGPLAIVDTVTADAIPAGSNTAGNDGGTGACCGSGGCGSESSNGTGCGNSG
ncbi:hypothetical protein EBR66_04865 [bacterium]|nr:hypothetical protein [bacterium]